MNETQTPYREVIGNPPAGPSKSFTTISVNSSLMACGVMPRRTEAEVGSGVGIGILIQLKQGGLD